MNSGVWDLLSFSLGEAGRVLDVVEGRELFVATFVSFEVFVVLQHLLHEALLSLRHETALIFELGLHHHLVGNSLLVVLDDFVGVPLPNYEVVLDPDSEVEVPIEVGEREMEELVAHPACQTTDLVSNVEVLAVPFIEVLITVVDQLHFIKGELLFFIRFRRIEHIP